MITGLWMGWLYLPGFRGLRIPNLTGDNLAGLAWHIRGITPLAIAFVVVGALIRLGGLG